MTRAVLYMRVSTVEQHPETQLLDLRQMAAQRGYTIIHEYTDRISGAKARRPGLDAMMADARRGKFDVVLVWAGDRLARNTRHFLTTLDELNRLQVEFLSFREKIDTAGPLGRAIVVIIGVVAELERALIVERVRAGMRRARLEGQHIGRTRWSWMTPPSNETVSMARVSVRLPKGIASRRPLCSACFASNRSRPRSTHRSWIRQPEPGHFGL